jgi:PHD/YefM family antitoxin component YafN of YafNO toxin-antitoxin module
MTSLKASETRIPPDTLTSVSRQGERVRIERRGGQPVYLVSKEDLELLEQIEDRIDLEAIRAAKHLPSKPWNQVKQALGL